MMQSLKFSVLFFLFSAFTVNAQMVVFRINPEIDLSAIVAEGEIVKQTCFYDEITNRIYTKNYLALRKVYKGDVSDDTVVFLTLGGRIGNSIESVSHSMQFNIGQDGIFMIKESDKVQGYFQISNHLAKVGDTGFLAGGSRVYPHWKLVEKEIGRICNTISAPLVMETNHLNQESVDFKQKVLVDPCVVTSVVVGQGQASLGTGQTVTITGSGFGDSPANSSIVAPNGDTGGYTKITLAGDSHHFNEGANWTDTSIKMNIEGALHPTYNITVSPIGSGKFQITPPSTVSHPCQFDLEIDFALGAHYIFDEFRTSGLVRRKSKAPDGKRHWNILTPLPQELLDQGITFEDIESVAKDVYCDWEMTTGVDYEYDGATTTRSSSDRLFTIYYETISSYVLMATLIKSVSGSCGSYPRYFDGYITDADISINPLKKWYVSTNSDISSTKFDLYSSFSHEVGHSLGLDHSMDSNPSNGSNDSRIMYYSTKKGLIKRNIDDKSADGVLWLVDKTQWSMNTSGECFDSDVIDFKTVPLNTPCVTPVSEVKNICDISLMSVVEQGDMLNIDFSESKTRSVILYSAFGQVVFVTRGHNKVEIPTGSLPKGMYYLQTSCGNKPQVLKVLIM